MQLQLHVAHLDEVVDLHALGYGEWNFEALGGDGLGLGVLLEALCVVAGGDPV